MNLSPSDFSCFTYWMCGHRHNTSSLFVLAVVLEKKKKRSRCLEGLLETINSLGSIDLILLFSHLFC